MKPKLSVVICTYNRGESLEKCLASLARQSFPHFEVVIIDGESTDQTHGIIAQFSKQLKIKKVVYQSKELARVRDRGWREAQGELVSWIDDDVIVSRDWAKSIVEIFDNNPEVGGASGPTIVEEGLLKNRDVFSLYYKKGILGLLGKFWNHLFLEGGMYEVGRIYKSGAWSPGSNFPRSLKIKGLKDVGYLEACNMTLRRNLIARVDGFDYDYSGIAEWSELDLSMRIKELGYRLVFSSKVRVDHNISQSGVYSRRTAAKQRMENFFKFYFRHIFKLRPDYLFKFLSYVLFLNYYWSYKAVTTKNLAWLGGWLGTVTGIFKTVRRKYENRR